MGAWLDGEPRRFRKYNAAGLFSEHGTLLDRYAKHHLLPIGETMPYQRWIRFIFPLMIKLALVAMAFLAYAATNTIP